MKCSRGKLVAVAISSLICAASFAHAEGNAATNNKDCAAHKSAVERQACPDGALSRRDAQLGLQRMAMNDAVAAEPEMVWTANRFDDGPESIVLLRYGIPESDAVGFEATCETTGGASAKTIFWYATDNLSEGQDVVLEVSGEDYDKKLPAKIYGTELEVGVSGISLNLPLDAPIWQALRRGSDLIYQGGGGRPEKLQLEGARKAVGKFLTDCKAIAAGASPQDVAAPQPKPRPDSPKAQANSPDAPVAQATKAETAKPPAPQAKPAPQQAESKAKPQSPPSDAAPSPKSVRLSCKRFGTIKSVESKTPVKVTFVNKSDGHRAVMWIDFEGHPVDYAGLDQGETFTTPTHLTHPWMITDGPGNCIEMFMPQEEGDTRFELTVPSPVFGPEDD